ncbi:MAG: hypothetical protein C5B55_06415 [Blastocatellia bacterium]|nr:MAG: hypothetical protein C5B55_06415 [Blastocatellia bacterium]
MFLAETSIQLVPDGTLLVHLVVIVVMVVVLNRTLLRPVNQILAEREKQIKSDMTATEQLEASRLEKVTKYNSTLRDARTEGYHLLERERSEALKRKDEEVRQAKLAVNQKVAAGLETVNGEEEQARKDLEVLAVTVSEEISERVFSGPR